MSMRSSWISAGRSSIKTSEIITKAVVAVVADPASEEIKGGDKKNPVEYVRFSEK